MEAQNTEKRDSEKQKKSKAGRAVAIAVIILLLLALIVCLIIIFTHRHTMTHYAYAEATCTAGGNAEYWYCAGCDGYFEDEEGENEVEFSGLILPAAGHEWMAASCDSPRRCNICGYSDGAALGHSWGDYEFSPSDCGSEGAILRVCTACGEVERIAVPVHGNAHNWGSIAVVQPSCVSAGRAVLTCADCGETVSSVIPATGAHHWDDGKITMPGCTGTGSIIHTCIDCGATETDVIPASGHVWVDATCTTAKTCAVCGATEGTALGHKWSGWTAYSDVHMRECETCGISEVEEHDFTAGDTCSVCNAEKPKPAGGSDNVAEITIESDYYYYGYLDTDLADYYAQYTGSLNGLSLSNYELPLSRRIFDPAGTLISDYCIKFTAETELNLSVSMPDNFVDTYVSAYNSSGVTIEYHPIRFTLYIENEAGEYDAVSDLSYLSMDEFIEKFNTVKPFDDAVSAGEVVDISFRIEAAWAEFIEEPNYFEIVGSDGNVYKFADKTNPSQLYLSFLDTAIGELAPGREDYSWATTCDSTGGVWTINYEDSYSYDFCYAIDINITQN